MDINIKILKALLKFIFAVICCILFGIIAIGTLSRSFGSFLFWGFACLVMLGLIKPLWEEFCDTYNNPHFKR
jgi:hypothetical protein